jgi:L-lactate dehydrogenase complex protein LldG
VNGARAEILGRVRAALGPSPGAPEVPRTYRRAGQSAADEVVERFCDRVSDYRATVHRVAEADLAAALAARCRELGARRIAVPAGSAWKVEGVELRADDPPLSARDLDGLDGVLSGCVLAIAETGTIVLDGGPASGRRALTLVPDLHLCVVRADDIVAGVPDAIGALQPVAVEGRPITFVSGPSATSDIELNRVEGVHGPRILEVFVTTS